MAGFSCVASEPAGIDIIRIHLERFFIFSDKRDYVIPEILEGWKVWTKRKNPCVLRCGAKQKLDWFYYSPSSNISSYSHCHSIHSFIFIFIQWREYGLFREEDVGECWREEGVLEEGVIPDGRKE